MTQPPMPTQTPFQTSDTPIAQDPMISPLNMHFAGFWKRLSAFIIDMLIWLIPAVAIEVIINFSLLKSPNTIRSTAFFIMQIINFFGQWLYYALMESSAKQGTLGKMAIGIKVTDLYGKRISFGRASGRYFSKAIPGFLAIFTLGIVPIIWFGMAGWTKKKQAVHDMMAGTYVVNK